MLLLLFVLEIGKLLTLQFDHLVLTTIREGIPLLLKSSFFEKAKEN